jgi:hypothetical protein
LDLSPHGEALDGAAVRGGRGSAARPQCRSNSS